MTETFREMAVRRAREIAEARRELAAKDAELANEETEVHDALRRFGIAPNSELEGQLRSVQTEQSPRLPPIEQPAPGAQRIGGVSNPQRVRSILHHAGRSGATKGQIVDAILAQWGIKVNSNTLSVQMNAMRKAGEIINKNQVWYLIGMEPT